MQKGLQGPFEKGHITRNTFPVSVFPSLTRSETSSVSLTVPLVLVRMRFSASLLQTLIRVFHFHSYAEPLSSAHFSMQSCRKHSSGRSFNWFVTCLSASVPVHVSVFWCQFFWCQCMSQFFSASFFGASACLSFFGASACLSFAELPLCCCCCLGLCLDSCSACVSVLSYHSCLCLCL